MFNQQLFMSGKLKFVFIIDYRFFCNSQGFPFFLENPTYLLYSYFLNYDNKHLCVNKLCPIDYEHVNNSHHILREK